MERDILLWIPLHEACHCRWPNDSSRSSSVPHVLLRNRMWFIFVITEPHPVAYEYTTDPHKHSSA